MAFQDEDVAPITLLLSPERLGKLTQLTGSAHTAVELHQETLSLGASLMNTTATIEIALRNSICEILSQHFRKPDWLRQPPLPFQWRESETKKVALALDSARRAEYSKLSQAEKAELDVKAFPSGRPPNTPHLRRVRARREHIIVTEGKVIAELTLYFWKRLYGHEYEQTLWRTALKRTFPNKKIGRADVAQKLEDIYQSRNRLAHHEPVLHKRFEDTLSAIKFVIENLGTRSPSTDTPLSRLLTEQIHSVTAQAKTLHDRLASFKIEPNSLPKSQRH
ncbi:MAG: hypothetical protein J0H38_04420 [Rhizobiales bacterium]|nr:hypothetical protein [Hyphomicrobiales bacterium]